MFNILFDEERALLKEITPWIIGNERADKNFAPIFKENTPAYIKEKYQEYLRFVEITKWRNE